MLKVNYSKANKILIASILAINIYVIALPLYPVLVLWWQDNVKHRPQQLAQLVAAHQKTKSQPAPPAVPAGERLIIPSISLDQPIVEGKSIYTVDQGVWRFYSGSTPPAGGNTVLIGHRFTYLGPAVFTHLDLVKTGDTIALWWNRREYTYTVSQIKNVDPNDTSIVQPTKDSRITIYTCTPMWTSKYRLAVIGELNQ